MLFPKSDQGIVFVMIGCVHDDCVADGSSRRGWDLLFVCFSDSGGVMTRYIRNEKALLALYRFFHKEKENSGKYRQYGEDYK